MLLVDGIAGTVDLAHMKAGYYGIATLNPTGIVPLGPAMSLPGASLTLEAGAPC